MFDTATKAGKIILKALVFFGALSKVLYTLAEVFNMLGKMAEKPVK